jgi:hypothetical protein
LPSYRAGSWPHCGYGARKPDLARILDDAARTRPAIATAPTFAAAPAGADIFTAVLRQRIVNHFNDCNVCDNCRTCNSKRRQLVGPYAPALIPILFAGEFRDRIDEVIRRVIERAHADRTPPRQADSLPPAAAAAGGGLSAMASLATGPQAHPVPEGHVSRGRPGDTRRPSRPGRSKAAPGSGSARRGRISARPLAVVAAVVVAAVVAVVVLLQSGSSGSSGMPVTATSALPPVTGDTYVQYLGGSNASATIGGQVNGATSGEVVRLYSRQFPFTAAPAPAMSLTLQPSGSGAAYSFRVTPTLATQYQVELFRNSDTTRPLATSATTTIYVVAIPQRVGSPTCVGRPTCQLTETHNIFVPPSALNAEMSKTWYSYLGLNLSNSGTPPLPATLRLGAGNPVVGKPQQIAANEFSVTISYTFNIGTGGYHFHSTLCAKDTEAQDGIGLPGSHGCGDSTISGSYAYLG